MEASAFQNGPAAFILSVSSDIGEHLALDHLQRGTSVIGTYRTELPARLNAQPGFFPVRCDINSPDAAAVIAAFLEAKKLRWNVFISCVGQLAPIGLFFESGFDEWSQSVQTNSLSQLRALHAAYPFRDAGSISHVVFFAGGGTNSPFPAYSAYCLGKIALIKMCELLDNENPDLNVFIVGTGWVRTKIHEQTLCAGRRAGVNFEKTKSFLEQDATGTSLSDIAEMIRWGIRQGKTVAGGRNFSLVHDRWREDESQLSIELEADPDKFKLRRYGNSPVSNR
jgi:NAD(P)-dependent dehydrogenase (short-subunit alcohol dehydrogenase family)